MRGRIIRALKFGIYATFLGAALFGFLVIVDHDGSLNERRIPFLDAPLTLISCILCWPVVAAAFIDKTEPGGFEILLLLTIAVAFWGCIFELFTVAWNFLKRRSNSNF